MARAGNIIRANTNLPFHVPNYTPEKSTAEKVLRALNIWQATAPERGWLADQIENLTPDTAMQDDMDAINQLAAERNMLDIPIVPLTLTPPEVNFAEIMNDSTPTDEATQSETPSTPSTDPETFDADAYMQALQSGKPSFSEAVDEAERRYKYLQDKNEMVKDMKRANSRGMASRR